MYFRAYRFVSPLTSLCNYFVWSNNFFDQDNQPEVTKILRKLLKENYNYDSTVCPYLKPQVIFEADQFL